jgi:cob(I)alamin adenosyltransferase
MKLDRIYTRSGDDGRTSLGDGARLPKFHVRVAAYGSVDEANSVIGIAMLHVADADIREVLARLQNDLFDLGGDLCRPEREHRKVEPLRVNEHQVTWIEEQIDAFNAALTPSTALCFRAAATRRRIRIMRARSCAGSSGT